MWVVKTKLSQILKVYNRGLFIINLLANSAIKLVLMDLISGFSTSEASIGTDPHFSENQKLQVRRMT